MNLRDLKYLVALADHQHFGKAAAACFVSQPALSMQIKKLEQTLGVKLIERNRKSVLFTEIGVQTIAYAREILQQVESMQEAAKSAKDPYLGELKVGIIPTLAPYLLPYIIPPLTRKFPKLTLFLVEEQTTVLIDKIKQGKLDTALLALPVNENGFTEVPLLSEEFLLAVPPTHPLARQKTVQQAELAGETLLLLEHGHCLRDQALELCYQVHAEESKSFRATSLETLRHMVVAGAGITLMPKLAYRAETGIVYLPFTEPKPTRTIGMIWRASTARKLVLQEMTAVIQHTMRKQGGLTSTT